MPISGLKIGADFRFLATWAFRSIYRVYLFGQQKKAASESTQRGSYMSKFVFSLVVCAAMCLPTASFGQDCGCEPTPAPACCPAPAPCAKTRKKLKLVDVQQQVCRTKRVCSTDCCGCPTTKRVRVSETVTRKKLTLVDVPVDPCRQGLLKRLRGRLGNRGGSCCPAPAPAPCGCAAPAPAPAPCGCDAAPAAMPTVMETPVEMMAAPVMAPTPAAPCCGG